MSVLQKIVFRRPSMGDYRTLRYWLASVVAIIPLLIIFAIEELLSATTLIVCLLWAVHLQMPFIFSLWLRSTTPIVPCVGGIAMGYLLSRCTFFLLFGGQACYFGADWADREALLAGASGGLLYWLILVPRWQAEEEASSQQ